MESNYNYYYIDIILIPILVMKKLRLKKLETV